jgi:hypothetical protein
VKNQPLKSKNDVELVEIYRDAASAQGRAMFSGDPKTANNHVKAIVAVCQILRSRGVESQRHLLPLLRHEDNNVRIWAASHALEFAPEIAEGVLEEIERTAKGFIVVGAHYVLKQWREGTYKFP